MRIQTKGFLEFTEQIFRETFFLAKPSHCFAYVCLGNVEMYKYAKFD